jgi:hypothetical protein
MMRYLVAVGLLAAAPLQASPLTAEVTSRCDREMAGYGQKVVKACIERDLEAARALQGYPEDAKASLARCESVTRQHGWSHVKACVDEDMEASAALGRYPAKHRALIERCRGRVGNLGASFVKACTDQEIEAEQLPRPRSR